MKRIIHAIAMRIHLHIGPLEDKGIVPTLYRWALRMDMKSGKAPFVLNGNSVVAGGLTHWAKIAGLRLIAIPGLKLGGIRANMFSFAVKAQPDLYIFDGGGNDFIAGANPDDVFAELKQAVQEARQALGQKCAIYWINIVPPGPLHPLLASTIAAFNARVKFANFVRIIDIHSRLVGADGFLKEEYRAPDHIHDSPLAYEKEWVPAISQIVEAHR